MDYKPFKVKILSIENKEREIAKFRIDLVKSYLAINEFEKFFKF